jgi:hypothetical protein
MVAADGIQLLSAGSVIRNSWIACACRAPADRHRGGGFATRMGFGESATEARRPHAQRPDINDPVAHRDVTSLERKTQPMPVIGTNSQVPRVSHYDV